MRETARFLHITDAHLRPDGSAFKKDDRKVNPQLEAQSRESAIESTLERLAERLSKEDEKLDAVIFSGDAMSAGIEGGDKLLLELICKQLGPYGVVPEKIVAVPGNHDIQRSVAPGSNERYRNFIEVWRDAGCVTPWLDGIDKKFDASKHILAGPDNAWVIIAVNSCNWSHVDAISPKLREIWSSVPEKLAPENKELQEEIRKELSRLERYDMARVSPDQLKAMRRMLADMQKPLKGRQIRILTLHHHLQAPSLAEEVKPFSDLSNLQQVRTFIAEQGINVVLHGHKHVGNVYTDVLEIGIDKPPHKSLIISGASFNDSDHSDAMRMIELDGLPWSPSLQLAPLAIPRDGLNGISSKPDTYRLWHTTDSPQEAPLVIQGRDFNEVYARVKIAAEQEANGKTLIVQLDLDNFSAVEALPEKYPLPSELSMQKRKEWLKQLVNWWQLPNSVLQERVPYIHGTRLHKYASNFDQIKRICDLLREGQTTRAIAILIDPTLDFKEVGTEKNDFASFCLVQFTKQKLPNGRNSIDCVGYYRAQEMVKWWPINVAELLEVLRKVGKEINCDPGRITTITACARALARSPTHVAMPAIDRWLDQTPEKYFVLASAFLNQSPFSSQAREVYDEWIAALGELKETLNNPGDGGPVVAIEGPRRLAKYLTTGNGSRSEECAKLAKTLERAANAGVSLLSAREQKTMVASDLADHLEEAITICRSLEANATRTRQRKNRLKTESK
ncbi:metallophosphoesterase [Delftia acidovorans]